MTKNLTSGKPIVVILIFAVPLVIGNLFQQFYSMADAVIVGNEIGLEALAAILGTGSLQFLILGFMMGSTAGASIITAQRFGAADEAGVRRSFAASLIICLVITGVIMVISISTLKPLLTLMNTPVEIFDSAYEYFVAVLWGMPALTLFNLLSNVMRAVGDSKTPLIFLIIACVINIALDYIFILIFHSGVVGAGIATVIAQLLSALACIPVIIKKLPVLRIRREDWRLDSKEYFVHLKMALPVGFQWSIIAIGTVAVSFYLNRLGVEAVAAFNAGQKIEQFGSMPLNSYGQAMTTFAAQNYGARKYGRIRTGVIQGSCVAVAFSLVMGAIFVLFGNYFTVIFMKDNLNVTALAHTYLKVAGCFLAFLALLFTFRQVIQGLGNAIVPTISGVAELIMRVLAAIFLTGTFAYTGLCFASPLAWIGCLVPLTIAMVITLKKLRLQEFIMEKQLKAAK